jgi:hypothetical protein
MVPLQVYLDSKDISILADRERGKNNDQALSTFDFLINQVERNAIEIRISLFHVAEVLPHSIEYKDAAMRRAKTSKELSRGKALKFFEDVYDLDIIHLTCSKYPLPKLKFPSYVFDDRSNWLPKTIDFGMNMKELIKQELTSFVKGLPVSRQQQRQIFRKIQNPDGTFKPFGKSILENGRSELMSSFKNNYPITNKFYEEDYPMLLISGKISENEFSLEIINGILDLENLAGWIYESSQHAKSISSLLYDQGSKFSEMISSHRQQANNLYERSKLLGIPEKDSLNILKKSIDKMSIRENVIKQIINDRKKNIAKHSKSVEFIETCIKSELGQLPFIDSMLSSMYEFSIDRIFQTKNQAKLSHSDYADIQHSGYLPFVDIFSCDSRTANYVRFTSQMYKTEVVSNFNNLKSVIENRIARINNNE